LRAIGVAHRKGNWAALCGLAEALIEERFHEAVNFSARPQLLPPAVAFASGRGFP
jgi:hypothetical protein